MLYILYLGVPCTLIVLRPTNNIREETSAFDHQILL